LVKILIEHEDVDVNIQAKLERTPLHEAAKLGLLDVVRILSNHPQIDINIKDKHGVSFSLIELQLNSLVKRIN